MERQAKFFNDKNRHGTTAEMFQNNQRVTPRAVKTSVETWLDGQGPDFYQTGLKKLALRSDKCLNRLGDYVEM
ncbi:hypothetical protein TNCV_966221 [Trichonephila clavipes]|nr:hypothetical protein TNCV_966221 [Trichonephila clavipes]